MKAGEGTKTVGTFSELRDSVEGDVLYDEMSRALYSSGACLYRIMPSCIVRPKNRMDVVNTILYAVRKGIPITARGGGTSRTGNELGEGIILDLSRYMNKILDFNRNGKWVRVQPGLILSSLNEFLKPYALFFPIDPSTEKYCTLGGMISNNSSGPHAVKYGTTRDYVLSLEVVLSNGEVISTGPVAPLPEKGREPDEVTESLERTVYKVLPEILKRYQGPMKEERPFTTKDSSGYHLWRLKGKGFMDLTTLFVGSEGSLGIVTEAKLKLRSIPVKALSGLVYLDDLGRVGETTQKILELSPSMVEIMERHILDLAREKVEEIRPYLPEGIEALLFIEFQGDDEEKLLRNFLEVEKRIIREEKLAIDLKIARDEKDMNMFSKVRSVSGPILSNIRGPIRPVAFIEDAAVHPSRLPQYIKGLRELFTKYRLGAGIYGHAGDGNLHTMVFMNLKRQDQVDKMVSLADEVYDLVLNLKGTISGEHGDGKTRTYYLKKQYPELYPAFVEIKNLFDPANIFNPGVIVGGEENPLGQHLKHGVDYHIVPTGSLFDGKFFRTEVETCSGCGKCRSYCPIAENVQEEWAMGRGKITLLREILSGHLDSKILATPEFKKVMDSCINCKRCLKECPSGVDIPWLSVIGRANFIKRHGERLSNRLPANKRLLCETGSHLAPLANWASTLAPARQFMEKAAGLDRRRYLPLFKKSMLRKFNMGRIHPDIGRKVVMFSSCSSNFNEPEGGELGTLDVLGHNNISVLIPNLRCCAIARINSGAMGPVMEDIRFNVEMMASYVEQGLDIVFSEPSCALAVKMEYPKILGTEASHRVAESCYDIHQYLMILYRKGELDLELGELKLTVGYHNPCHLRALGVDHDIVELLELIPGLHVRQYSDGCCGLGGTFGMKKDNFDLSMEIGKRLFREIEDSKADRIVTSCVACAMQIFQGTLRRAIHPVSMLAMAYKKRNRG